MKRGAPGLACCTRSSGEQEVGRTLTHVPLSFPVSCSLPSRVLSQMPGARWGLTPSPPAQFSLPVLTLFLVSQASHHSASSLLHCHKPHGDHSPGSLSLGPPARAGRKQGWDHYPQGVPALWTLLLEISPLLFPECLLSSLPNSAHSMPGSRACHGHAIPGHQGLSQLTLFRMQAPDCP